MTLQCYVLLYLDHSTMQVITLICDTAMQAITVCIGNISVTY